MKLIPGENDFMTLHPELMADWDFRKNTDVDPSRCSEFSNKKVWWLCGCGYEWQARINNRSRGSSCPICSRRDTAEKTYFRNIPFEESLEGKNPSLAMEWDDEKNHPLNPWRVYAHSNKKVWWKCREGHSWVASVNNRSRGNGCPFCARQKRRKA